MIYCFCWSLALFFPILYGSSYQGFSFLNLVSIYFSQVISYEEVVVYFKAGVQLALLLFCLNRNLLFFFSSISILLCFIAEIVDSWLCPDCGYVLRTQEYKESNISEYDSGFSSYLSIFKLVFLIFELVCVIGTYIMSVIWIHIIL